MAALSPVEHIICAQLLHAMAYHPPYHDSYQSAWQDHLISTAAQACEGLSQLGARLLDHADSITNIAAHEMEQDLRVAGRSAPASPACDSG
jgi:hypothetical protein